MTSDEDDYDEITRMIMTSDGYDYDCFVSGCYTTPRVRCYATPLLRDTMGTLPTDTRHKEQPAPHTRP